MHVCVQGYVCGRLRTALVCVRRACVCECDSIWVSVVKGNGTTAAKAFSALRCNYKDLFLESDVVAFLCNVAVRCVATTQPTVSASGTLIINYFVLVLVVSLFRCISFLYRDLLSYYNIYLIKADSSSNKRVHYLIGWIQKAHFKRKPHLMIMKHIKK